MDDRRQFSPIFEREGIKRISSFFARSGSRAFDVVNIDADDSFAAIPRLFNFVLYPWSTSCLCANKHDDTPLIFHIFVYPAAYSRVAGTLQAFPLISGRGRVAFNRTNIANLLDSHYVVVEVEAIENGNFSHESSFGIAEYDVPNAKAHLPLWSVAE